MDAMEGMPHGGSVRLAEVVGSLSLATGLCTGLPIEHGLRRALLATWLGQEMGLGNRELSDAYYVALLGSVGCTVEQTLFARYATDDIALNAKTYEIDPANPLSVYAFGILNFGTGQPPLRRARTVLSSIASGGPGEFQAVCRDVAQQIGDMIEIGPTIQQALTQCHELWNGRGGPRGLKHDEIALPARIFHVAASAEVFTRTGGAQTAVAHVRRLTGRHYDPRIVARFAEVAEPMYRRLESVSAWDAVLAAEPEPIRWLTQAELDRFVGTIARFADLRSPYTLEHSTGVARLAERAARSLGLDADDVVAVRRAGELHDLGRIGVPAAFWNTSEPWTGAQRERARQHPALTEQVLARSDALGPLGLIAGLHHERLDGSGYRGVTAPLVPMAARILAAADAYHTKIEPRPHRPAMQREAAAQHLLEAAGAGQLDAEAARAVVEAAGITTAAADEVPAARPAGLTEREVEVLRLLVRGLSNREMAERLVVSPKTIGRHIENIYVKLDVSTRVGATLFAVEHGLVEERSS